MCAVTSLSYLIKPIVHTMQMKINRMTPAADIWIETLNIIPISFLYEENIPSRYRGEREIMVDEVRDSERPIFQIVTQMEY